MRVIKDVKPEELTSDDQLLVKKIMEKLRGGNRVFGNVAEGLKQTLKNRETELENLKSNRNPLDYLENDSELLHDIKLLKAGINGEEELAEYLRKIIKLDKSLQDVIFFASLSDPEQNEIGEENGYIADSDFIALYDRHILIMDAKNIATSSEIPIYLEGNNLMSTGNKPLLELHPSTYVWKNIFTKNGVMYNSLHGCTVIINKSGSIIWKNSEWYESEVKPLHISELIDFLHSWIENTNVTGTPEVPLSLLLILSKMQIKTVKSQSIVDIRDKIGKLGF